MQTVPGWAGLSSMLSKISVNRGKLNLRNIGFPHTTCSHRELSQMPALGWLQLMTLRWHAITSDGPGFTFSFASCAVHLRYNCTIYVAVSEPLLCPRKTLNLAPVHLPTQIPSNSILAVSGSAPCWMSELQPYWLFFNPVTVMSSLHQNIFSCGLFYFKCIHRLSLTFRNLCAFIIKYQITFCAILSHSNLYELKPNS